MKALPVSKSEPSESSDDATSVGSLDSCRILYNSSQMMTRIFDMKNFTTDEETMLLHLKMSQMMVSKIGSKLTDNIAKTFSKFTLGVKSKDGNKLNMKSGQGPRRKSTRLPKYEQFDEDKRNFSLLMDQYRDHGLEERAKMRQIISTLYDRVGGKDRVWRQEKPEPVRINSTKAINIGYTCQLIDWTPLDVEDFESSQILLSTISYMSDFSKTSSLVHNESITVGEGYTKKRNPTKIARAETRAIEHMRHFNEDKIVDRYLEYTKEGEDGDQDAKETTFFDVDDYDDDTDTESYDSENGDSSSQMKSAGAPTESAQHSAEHVVNLLNDANANVSKTSLASSDRMTFALVPCHGLQ